MDESGDLFADARDASRVRIGTHASAGKHGAVGSGTLPDVGWHASGNGGVILEERSDEQGHNLSEEGDGLLAQCLRVADVGEDHFLASLLSLRCREVSGSRVAGREGR